MNILIIGLAKTGTTGISKNIENSMENTKYFLEPKNVYFTANPEHTKTNNIVKILFEHWNQTPHLRQALIKNETNMKFDKIVYIVRDPRDNLISRLFYAIHPMIRTRKDIEKAKLDEWVSLVEQKENDPKDVPFGSLMHGFHKLFKMDIYSSIGIYKQYFNFIDKNGENGFVIKYEDFIDRKLAKLSEYLGFDISDNDDVGDALSRTVRSKAYNNWKHLFTEKDIPIMKQKLNANLLAKYDYTDWSLDENPIFSQNEGSMYIKNLILDATAKNNA